MCVSDCFDCIECFSTRGILAAGMENANPGLSWYPTITKSMRIKIYFQADQQYILSQVLNTESQYESFITWKPIHTMMLTNYC